jgi:hypothetical protein
VKLACRRWLLEVLMVDDVAWKRAGLEERWRLLHAPPKPEPDRSASLLPPSGFEISEEQAQQIRRNNAMAEIQAALMREERETETAAKAAKKVSDDAWRNSALAQIVR